MKFGQIEAFEDNSLRIKNTRFQKCQKESIQ